MELNENAEEPNQIFVFQVSFYPTLKYGFVRELQSLEVYSSNLANSINIFDFNMVFIPIQKTDHWALVV